MCRLLIVSDGLAERMTIRELIEESFMNIKILPDATTEEEAVKIANRLLPEMMLLDMDTSSLDGFSLEKKLSQQLPNLKTIIFTKKNDFETVHHALRCGFLDYLVKPIDLDELKFAIDRSVRSLNQVSLMDILNNKPSNLAKEQVNMMLDYIHEHFDEEINLTSLSDRMHLNRHYVSRFFKEAVGMNFIDYLTNYRIEKAKQLLMKTDDSITEIAGTVGYLDATYFSKLFKKKAGFSPYQYRKKLQGECLPTSI